jgi:hypothetical protein
METSLNFIRDTLETEVKELKVEVTLLKQFRDEVNKKVAYIGGVAVAGGLILSYVIDWAMAHLHFK